VPCAPLGLIARCSYRARAQGEHAVRWRSTRDRTGRLIRSSTVLSHCRSRPGPGAAASSCRIGASARRRAGRCRLERREVEQARRRGSPVAGDALVVIDASPQPYRMSCPEHLDRARMMRGMTVDQVDAAVDQSAGEASLVRVQRRIPVRSPVDGRPPRRRGPPGRLHLADDPSAVAGDRSGDRLTPAGPGRRPGGRIPLEAVPQEMMTARLPPRPDGRRPPAPPSLCPARPRARSPAPDSLPAECRPAAAAESSTWLFASAHTSGRAAATQGTLPGLIR